MLQDLINNFYFTEKEAKVYLAALQLGRSKVSAIARKAELNRITAYEILKKLVKMGISHSAEYRGVQTFTVVSPDILVSKMESRLKIAHQMLPQIALLNHTSAGKPNIAFFEGVEGIRTIYEDTLSSKEKIIYNIANPAMLLQVIGKEFFAQYVKKRTRHKIQVQVLLPDTPENKKFKPEANVALRAIKFFDVTKYPLPNEILIYDNKVALLSFSSLTGVIVDDKDIAQSVRSLWQMVWYNIK